MIKKGITIGIVIVFLVGSFASGITINLKDSVQQSGNENTLNVGSSAGLVAHWDFDVGTGSVLYDVTGNGNDGTINGANWTNGISGYALDFDGLDDYVDIGDPSNVLDFGSGDFTESYWIYPYSIDGDYIGHISLWNPSPSLRLSTVFHSGNLQIYTNDSNWHDTGKTVQIDQWSHIVWVKNGNMLKLFINGSDSGWSMIQTNSVGPFNEMLICNHPGPGFFNGTFDEISFYNRALTSGEIQYLYNNPEIGDTVYVDDDFNSSTSGWQIDHFDNIQDGIDAVNINGTVYVNNGTYYENVVVNKTINLIGENKNTTVIDDNYNENVVFISADWVNISGFTIRDGDYGINMSSNYSTVTGNTFTYNWRGLVLWYSNNNTITGNTIINPQQGYGIYLIHSNNTTIISNIISKSTFGIYLLSSNSNSIKGNNISYNEDYLYGGGIWLSDSNNNTITGNIISKNWIGIYLYSSSNNIIYHNNFIDNDYNANDECNNSWNDSYPSGGNYWDDYTGIDADGDGIGDIPYNISGGSNQDLYPLMYPWGENPPIANFNYSNNTSSVLFNGSSSFDRDGEIIVYEWDFGDGTSDSGEIISHKYCDNGTYDVKLTVTDDDGLIGNITKSIEVIFANIPPSIPEIFGPNSGRPRVEYEYVFLVTDPDGDEIYLIVEWGDGTCTGWIGPYDSGETVKLSHEWYESGAYVIKAKLKDYCNESAWDLLEVTMPRNYAINTPFLNCLQNFFETNPNLFPLLQLLLQRVRINLN